MFRAGSYINNHFGTHLCGRMWSSAIEDADALPLVKVDMRIKILQLCHCRLLRRGLEKAAGADRTMPITSKLTG
jgi:hypothetical protein